MERVVFPFGAAGEEYDPLRSLQNKIDSYNTEKVKDDGTGICCNLCRGDGTVAYDDNGSLRIRDCKCNPLRQTIIRLQRIGIYERAKNARFDNYIPVTEAQKVMKQKAESFVKDSAARWLSFFGQSGAGKTHLCTAVFTQLCEKLYLDGQYFLWCDDGRKLKLSVTEDAEALREKFKKCGVLYIDDLLNHRNLLTRIFALLLRFSTIDTTTDLEQSFLPICNLVTLIVCTNPLQDESERCAGRST